MVPMKYRTSGIVTSRFLTPLRDFARRLATTPVPTLSFDRTPVQTTAAAHPAKPGRRRSERTHDELGGLTMSLNVDRAEHVVTARFSRA
jgi:hypothetical protein